MRLRIQALLGIEATADYKNGKVIVQVELTKERQDITKDLNLSLSSTGQVKVDRGMVTITYEGGTAEEVFNKMRLDSTLVPSDKKFRPANRKKHKKLHKNREAVIQRLVDRGIVPKSVARAKYWWHDYPVNEEQAGEVLNNPKRFDEMANIVRTILESTSPEEFERLYRITKEEALGKKD
jgi:hypothetical protein